MIGSFEYKGTASMIFKLVCMSIKRPMLAAIRPKSKEIYGKSGIIDYGENDYSPKPIIMHIAYKGESYAELRRRAREIAAWLSSEQWEKLIINDEPDKYYLARVIGGVDLDTFKKTGQADITFECQPFAYMVIDTDADLTWGEANFPWGTDIPWGMSNAYTFSATANTSFEFENPGTKEIDNSSPQGSKFNVVITGTWTTLSISLNGKTLGYVGAGTGTLVINNIDMEATLDGLNDLDNIDGDIDSFLSIIPGQNSINVSGTGLNITVQIVFAPMWL
ncbi:MAG: phage tail component [Clostridia bacterium]|jgi:predicted phage tail component-like protein|nr:phage tail component [Clostridia bacterium]